MEAMVPILRREIEAVRAAGADVIQLDEPWLSVMVDPEFRAGEGIGDPEPEMELCIDLLNRTLEGVSGIDTAMHLCHAHFQHQHSTAGSYDPIMPALARARVGTILMEYATPDAGGLQSLAGFHQDARLGLGLRRPLRRGTSSRRRRSWPAWRRPCATWTRSGSCSTPTAASRRRSRTRSRSTRPT